MEVLKVSSGSNPNSVAGALAGVIRESDQAEVQAEAAGTAPVPAADDTQNDKNDAEQPKPVDLRTDTEKERDHGVF